jgi:hypothetical protein
MREGLDTARLEELAEAFAASRKAHLGETPDDITKAERAQQAANAGITGSSGMSKEEIASELSKE